jgi:hypothetical protein
MAKGRKGRGKLSSFETLPREADHIVAWVNGELADRKRTQVEIHAEFEEKCRTLMEEFGGDLEFDIPSLSALNRLSVRQAKLARMRADARDMMRAVGDDFDIEDSDGLTIFAVDSIKALVNTLLADGDPSPKQALELASAVRQAVQAQNMSAEGRRKYQEEVDSKMEKAVDTVGKAKGMTAETVAAIKSEILGVSS